MIIAISSGAVILRRIRPVGIVAFEQSLSATFLGIACQTVPFIVPFNFDNDIFRNTADRKSRIRFRIGNSFSGYRCE